MNLLLTKSTAISIMTIEQMNVTIRFCEKENVFFKRIYIDHKLIEDSKMNLPELKQKIVILNQYFESIFISLPSILRERDLDKFSKLYYLILELNVDGVLVHCLEEFAYIRARKDDLKIVTNSNLYIWNHNSLKMFSETIDGYTFPYELTKNELGLLERGIQENNENLTNDLIFYGRTPMMITANCIKNTYGRCNHIPSFEESIVDRKGVTLPVYSDCMYCYNIIYNSVVTSLHNKMKEINKLKVSLFRICFTIENTKETNEILDFFFKENVKECPIEKYTTGHWNRETL